MLYNQNPPHKVPLSKADHPHVSTHMCFIPCHGVVDDVPVGDEPQHAEEAKRCAHAHVNAHSGQRVRHQQQILQDEVPCRVQEFPEDLECSYLE